MEHQGWSATSGAAARGTDLIEQVRIVASPSSYRLGNRGQFPVEFYMPRELVSVVTDIPGVIRAPGGAHATWDAAFTVAARFGDFVQQQLLACGVPHEAWMTAEARQAEARALPGLADLRASKAWSVLRPYQLEAAAFLAARAQAMCCDEMRLGKTLATQAAAKLTAGRLLVVSPATVRYVWAEEHARWFGLPSLVLEGLSGDAAKLYCPKCSGKAPDTECVAPQYGLTLSNRIRAAKYLHRVPAARIAELCATAPMVVANYDILVPRAKRDARGVESADARLRGWAPHLASAQFQVIVGDESHRLRGWTANSSARGRREMFAQVSDSIPQCWLNTGTPIVGRVKNLWAQLDIISRGALTSAGRMSRTPFGFDAYFCKGAKIEGRGWYRDGCDPRVASELSERRKIFTIERYKKDVWEHLPERTRQVVAIDAPKGTERGLRHAPGAGRARLEKAILATAKLKISTIVDELLEEALSTDAGVKLVVLAYHRESVAEIVRQLSAALAASKETKLRAQAAQLRIWSVTGAVSPEGRAAMCTDFRDHAGAGIVAATLDSIPEGISLRGAQTMHFLDLHWNPMVMLQAEERPLEMGARGVTLRYYHVVGSVDEYIYGVVIPKIEHILATRADGESAKMQRDLGGAHQEAESADEILRKMAESMDFTDEFFVDEVSG